jgi:hypothetical protein
MIELDMNSCNPRFYLFCCILHKYLLHLYFYKMIEHNMKYALIFFLLIFPRAVGTWAEVNICRSHSRADLAFTLT